MGCFESKLEEPAPLGPNTLSSIGPKTKPIVETTQSTNQTLPTQSTNETSISLTTNETNAAGVGKQSRPLPSLPTKATEDNNELIDSFLEIRTISSAKAIDNQVDSEFVPTPEDIEKVSGFTYQRGNNFKWKGTYLAKYVKPYDGDTGTFVLHNGVQLSLRLARIDTPELNINTMPQEWKRSERLLEKEEAEASLNKLIELIGPSGLVVAHLQGSDKYGRTLTELYSFQNNEVGESINQQMLDLHYAIPYDGGKKQVKVGALLRQLRG